MRNKQLVRIAVLFLLALGSASALLAQTDPRIGAWVLNAAKSKYTPGPAPTKEVRTYAAKGDAISVTIESVTPQGNRSSLSYTVNENGKDYPLKGLEFADAVAMKRVDSRKFEVDTKKDGKSIGITRGEISSDGKTLTLVSQFMVANRIVTNVAVYDKQ